jgi:hypothetical protein
MDNIETRIRVATATLQELGRESLKNHELTPAEADAIEKLRTELQEW